LKLKLVALKTELESSAKISRYTGKQNPGRNFGGTGFQPVQKTLIYQIVIHRLEACATGFFSFEADLSSLKPFSQRFQLAIRTAEGGCSTFFPSGDKLSTKKLETRNSKLF
jgi:hypothetical protein